MSLENLIIGTISTIIGLCLTAYVVCLTYVACANLLS